MAESKINVLIVGATGSLGHYVTRECLKRPELRVSTLVLDVNKDQCLCDEVSKAGGKCIQADLTKPETFKDCCKGIHTVISTVMGNDEVMLKGQCNLLDDAIKNNVKRFVPSDFTFDIWNLKQGDNYFIDQRLKFRQILESKSNQIKGLHFTHGIFMETYFWLVDKWGFNYWGDINNKIDLTATEDVGKFVAAAVSRGNRFGDVKIVGQELSIKQILEIYNLVSGSNTEPKCLGSVEDLKKRITELKGGKDLLDLVHCELLLPVYDGRAKIKNPMNSEFPEVKTLNLDIFLKQSQGKGTYHYTIPEVLKQCEKEICTK